MVHLNSCSATETCSSFTHTQRYAWTHTGILMMHAHSHMHLINTCSLRFLWGQKEKERGGKKRRDQVEVW